MTSNNQMATTPQATDLTPDRIDRGLQWLKHLQTSQGGIQPSEIGTIRRSVDLLSQPASKVWIAARALATLTPYFDKDVPLAVREMEADDWVAALSEYPEWAILRAARWWKSAENPRRHRRPLEGDIEERCIIEMDPVRGARRGLDSGLLGLPKPPEVERERITAERAAEIMAKAGYVTKRFGANNEGNE